MRLSREKVFLRRLDAAAQGLQLAIEYAPNPVFHSGAPESAPAEVLENFQKKYGPIGTAKGRRRLFATRQGTHARVRADLPVRSFSKQPWLEDAVSERTLFASPTRSKLG